MPIEGFSKYHICKNGRLYSIHSGTWRLIKPVLKNTGYISNNLYWGTPRENTQQCIRDGRFSFRKKKLVDENRLIHQYNLGIPRKDILEEFQISTKLLYMILRKYNVKLRKS